VIVIGVDSHKQTHTAVAVDGVGRRLAERTVRASSDGHLQLVDWARSLIGDLEAAVSFAVEDCRHLTRRLEGDLLAAGFAVIRVPTRLMADSRRSARSPGKSDPIDAEAVAMAALRYPDLPTARLDGAAREVKLLSAHRADLVKQRTRVASRLRWYLHELDPDLQVPARGLRHRRHVQQVQAALDAVPGMVARLARGQLDRLLELNIAINALDKELKTLVTPMAPALLAVPGCGVLSAAVIIGEVAGIDRFRDKDAFARFTGTAPVPVWSGSSAGKVRLNRGGNRTMNWALHMIAVTQARGIGPGKAYLDKQHARGKDRVAAYRLLRRRLSDTVFTALRADAMALQAQASTTPPIPAASGPRTWWRAGSPRRRRTVCG
jgi:transposase